SGPALRMPRNRSGGRGGPQSLTVGGPRSGLSRSHLSSTLVLYDRCTHMSSTVVLKIRGVPMGVFADRLKTLREEAGLSQRELGERAGLTRDAVSSLEQGRREPTWETVQALASAL